VLAPEPTESQRFGTAVALQGEWLAIGAPGEPLSINTNDPGRVFVYRQNAGQYELAQVLQPSDGAARDRFGMRLDFAGDQLLVTASRHRPGPSAAPGAIYTYSLSAGTWTPGQKLPTGSGSMVSVDGSLIVSGRSQLTTFHLQDGTWVAQTPAPSDPPVYQIEGLVVLDGQPARIAATGRRPDTLENGAFVYEWTGSGWSAPRLASAADSSGFAPRDVALTAHRLLIGDYNFSPLSMQRRGVARSYLLSGGFASLEQVFSHGGELLGDRFGNAIALQGDWMIAAAEGRDQAAGSGMARDGGSAWILRRQPDGWALHQELSLADTPKLGDVFGRHVDLKGDLAVVASRRFTASSFFGALEVYRRSGDTWNHLCSPAPQGIDVSGETYVGVKTDGEHIVASVGSRLFAWRATNSGCESMGEILPPTGSAWVGPVSNLVEGRLLMRMPLTTPSTTEWAVVDFDGQAWTTTATISGACDTRSGVLASRTRVAFACAPNLLAAGPIEIAQIMVEGPAGWSQTHLLTSPERQLLSARVAWEGDTLLVQLGNRSPMQTVLAFAAPEYAAPLTLTSGDAGCAGSADTVLAAAQGAAVLGCPDFNGSRERRSGRLLAFRRTSEAPAALSYGPGVSIELPANPVLFNDDFESR
jgi:hypothetical protein